MEVREADLFAMSTPDLYDFAKKMGVCLSGNATREDLFFALVHLSLTR